MDRNKGYKRLIDIQVPRISTIDNFIYLSTKYIVGNQKTRIKITTLVFIPNVLSY
jgi:hypothetical protein